MPQPRRWPPPPPLPDAGGPAPVSGTAPSLPAHDLAALVDRLVEARSAAQSGDLAQPVRTTVHHGDFGPVALHFEAGANGLSVTASSPDPGFASAAQSALAVAAPREGAGAGLSGDRPGGQGQTSGAGGNGQFASNGQAGSGQAGNGQPGGGARGDAGFARNSPVPATTTREAPGDGAIFA